MMINPVEKQLEPNPTVERTDTALTCGTAEMRASVAQTKANVAEPYFESSTLKDMRNKASSRS
jgi:hypothetical protein